MGKPVWPDRNATVEEMQAARWYLTAVMSPDDVKLGDLSKGEAHGIEVTPKRAIEALELALSHAEGFRQGAWAEVERLKGMLSRFDEVADAASNFSEYVGGEHVDPDDAAALLEELRSKLAALEEGTESPGECSCNGEHADECPLRQGGE